MLVAGPRFPLGWAFGFSPPWFATGSGRKQSPIALPSSPKIPYVGPPGKGKLPEPMFWAHTTIFGYSIIGYSFIFYL
jgi:hypothetical protein